MISSTRDTRPPGLLTALIALAMLTCACSRQEQRVQADERPPLQPLIYTELPDLTAAASAVRERRLLRELLHGSDEKKRWGRLQRRENLPAPIDEPALGKVLAEALIERDEAKWDHAFVSPPSYAGMVHVELENARKFVDELQGDSAHTWELFDIALESEAPENGLASILEFDSLVLGPGRTVSGKRTRKKQDVVAQHWNNVLKLKLKDTDVILELQIAKILRVSDRRKLASGEPILAIASSIKPSRRLETFFDAGLHLKPELLRSQEYPYPLSVGNFWRYRRFIEGKKAQVAPSDSLDLPVEQDAERRASFQADDVLLEILNIERYGSLRLVKYRVSYNDPELTVRTMNWIITPRRIYDCGRNCSKHVGDLAWLLDHLKSDTPRYHFPLLLGGRWSEEGKSPSAKNATVRIADRAEKIEVPAGTFPATIALESPAGKLLHDPFLEISSGTRYFAQGKGVIKIVYRGKNTRGEQITVIEELVESRIMP